LKQALAGTAIERCGEPTSQFRRNRLQFGAIHQPQMPLGRQRERIDPALSALPLSMSEQCRQPSPAPQHRFRRLSRNITFKDFVVLLITAPPPAASLFHATA
jgi:hypothetical protein